MKKTLLLFTLLFCSCQFFAQSTVFEWEQLPSPSRNGIAIFYQTQQGYLISKLTDPEYKYILSKDTGKTWTEIIFPLPYNQLNLDINFKEDAENNLYFKTHNDLYLYDFSKNTFSKFFTSLNTNSVWDFAIKYDNIYVTDKSGLFVFSKATGKLLFKHTWNKTLWGYANIIVGGKDKNFINFSTGGVEEYLYRFKDDGTILNKDTIPTLLLDLSKVEITKSGKLFVKDYTNLWTSIDDGANWTKTYCVTPPPNTTIDYKQLKINPSGEIYVNTYDALFYSNDDGKNWENIKIPPLYEKLRDYEVFNKVNGQVIIAPESYCTNNKFFVSNDKGKTWDTQTFDLNPPNSERLIVTKDEDVINADCTGFNDLLIKNSNKWQNINEDNKYRLYNIIVFPSGKWFAVDYYTYPYYKYFESFDKGTTWSLYTKSPVANFTWNKFITHNQDNELLIFEDNSYYISKDEGYSWTKINTPNLVKIDEMNLNNILMKNGIIYFQSNNNYKQINYYDSKTQLKKSFQLPDSLESCSNLKFFNFLDDGKLCMVVKSSKTSGNEGVIILTSDLGKTLEVNTIKIDKWSYRFDFCVDKNNNFIYSNHNKNEISYDRGKNWQSINGNLTTGINISSMVLSPNQYLYISTYNGTIYKAKYPLDKTAKITGEVFADANGNCIKDLNENYLKNVKINAANGDENSILSSNSGSFRFNVFKGVYNISTISNANVYLPCQSNYTVKIDNSKDSIHLNIPIKIKKYCADLSVSLGSPLPLRRCFSNTYYGKVCNDGTKDAKNTKITIQLDSLFDFESASLPVLSLVNQTLILDAGTVDYGDCKNFTIKFTVSCKSALGQEHCISLAVSSPDACDNEQPGAQAKPYLECKKNVGSYDPNDKTAFVDGRQTTTKVKAGQKIEYLVRFQNTGTDTAFNIVVKDPIHANLEVSSIVMGASSHAYTWEVRENILSVTFKNIMLPDSNVNEKTSHGFFKFLIQPKSNVTTNDLVTNTAAIYFDFNEPIFTNEAILNKKTIKTNEVQREIDFFLYPNPATEQVTLSLPQRLEGESNVFLYSIDGRLLTKKSITENNATFDIHDLPKGIYFIHVKNKTQFGVKKFVKQ